LKRVKEFYRFLKYHAFQFGMNLKIFNDDNMTAIPWKISIRLHRVLSQKRNIQTRIHCVSIIQRYINTEAGDAHNNYSALNN